MTEIETPFRIELRAFEDTPVEGSSGIVLVDPLNPVAALEIIFGAYNHGSPYEMKFDHRSLSVGDVVHLGETSWLCASVGWERAR